MGYTQLILNTDNFSLSSVTSSPTLSDVSNITNTSVNNTTINSFGGIILNSAVPLLKHTFDSPQYLNKVIINFASATGVKTGTLTFYDEQGNKIPNGGLNIIGSFPNPGSDDDSTDNEFLFTQPFINPIKVKAFEFRFSVSENAHVIGIDHIKAFIPDNLQKYRQRDYNIEFNDSLLDMTSWKNSRYDGSKIQGSQINKFVEGDPVYGAVGKKPVIENKVSALFIGNAIQDGGDATSSLDPLVEIKNHSYVTIDAVLLINRETKEVTKISHEQFNESEDKKESFRRLVADNFPEGSEVVTKLLDISTPSQLKESHFVKLNQGLLMNIYSYQANDEGKEDGVFGGFGLRDQKGILTDNIASGSNPGGGLFGFGMTFEDSQSLFTSESITTINEIPSELSLYGTSIGIITSLNSVTASNASDNTLSYFDQDDFTFKAPDK